MLYSGLATASLLYEMSPSRFVVLFGELFTAFDILSEINIILLSLPCDAMRGTVLLLVIVILSVRLSVCHTRALCPHGSTYDHDFFTIG